ncbi:MAG: PTS IIA-like nitrogen-regulatory protein PtsN [Rhodospirillaceae bacterium]|nr:PTS IIA-like nitrogen-regulatory protein PtsN [Rhodospirillaceae bacterium]|tara:strand:+ start:930 stop:1394 length:465 start_codon:yes stop_codon:yes gene_type:complete
MEINKILSSETIISDLKVSGKKHLFQELSQKASQIVGVKDRVILTTLLDREKLGTTGIGQGVAIPHGKISELKKPIGFFARLIDPIEFEAVDDKPVDLIFLLLAPEDANAENLKTLAKISRMLRDKNLCDKIRGSVGNDALFSVLTDSLTSFAA